jgi:hypothetical protein
MVCSEADNEWSRFKSFTNTEALDEGERYNNTIFIDVKDVCILISINNVNRNTTPSLYEKVVQHFKINDLQQCVTNPTTIYGSTLDLVFTGGHLPSNICLCNNLSLNTPCEFKEA